MGPPAWLFSQNPNNDTRPSTPSCVPATTPDATMAKKSSDKKAKAKATATATPQPPAQLLDLVERFLSDNALEAAEKAFKAQRAKNDWPAAAKSAPEITLLSVFQAWEKTAPAPSDEKKSTSSGKTLKRKEPPSSAESSEASSSESSSESSDSDSDDEAEPEAKPEVKVKTEPEANKSKPQAKKQKTLPDAESSSSSSSESESEPESSSDESSSSEESDSDSDEEEGNTKTAEPAPKPDSDSDSDSSDSDSDSDEEEDTKPVKEEPKIKQESASEDTTPAPTTNGTNGVNGVNGNGNSNGKKQNEPFSRIPKDIKVDPKFASNEYVPVTYSLRAHEDLIVTRGKGFTKEKNKKKKGSFRGGNIDIHEKKSIYFDD